MVGAREPCPCGSGRRYKACHGRVANRASDPLVRRPFRGLPSEPEWVALREIVPAATAVLTLAPGTDAAAEELSSQPPAGRTLTLATVLPMAWPAMVRGDGSVYLGLQVAARSGDISRDLAVVVEQALTAAPGSSVVPVGPPGTGRRLQDLVAAERPLEVTVRSGFDFWVEGVGAVTDEVVASLERANAAVIPTERVAGVEAAYWCRMPERAHLRWVLPYDEEPLVDAMARLFPVGGLSLGEGTRYVGSFRAHGLLVPVWDVPHDSGSEELEGPLAELASRLADAVADDHPLTAAQQRSRSALAGRQLTIR